MDIFADTPELMTVQDYHLERVKRRGLQDTPDTRIRSMQLLGEALWNAFDAGLPLNADAVIALRDNVGPDPECNGYIRHGDRYVWRNGIKCAAISHGGKVYEGKRHSDIILDCIREGVKMRPLPEPEQFGFVTDGGRFVGREEALRIALDAGQVKAGRTLSDRILHSDDIL